MGHSKKSSEPPTQDTFAQWVTDGIRKAGATAAIVYDRERFYLSEGGKDGTVYSDNYFSGLATIRIPG